MGHLGVSPGGQYAQRWGLVANGLFSWELSEAVHGPGASFFATNVHAKDPHAPLRLQQQQQQQVGRLWVGEQREGCRISEHTAASRQAGRQFAAPACWAG